MKGCGVLAITPAKWICREESPICRDTGRDHIGVKQQSRPTLPDVTLVAVSSIAIPAVTRALEISMDRVCFARAILLSHECPTNSPAEWHKIPRLQSRADYSRFMLRELANHIDTSHALCIQWDGFVLNGNAWLPVFLEYDYIGSVWPQFHDGRNVGNGGFSLRSK